MTATMRMALLSICIVFISVIVGALPADQGAESKLEFPDSSKDIMQNPLDIYGSTFQEKAFFYVDYEKLNDSSEYGPEHRKYTIVLVRFDSNAVITSNQSCSVEFKPDQLALLYDTMKYSLHQDKIVFAYISVIPDFEQKVFHEFYHNYGIVHMDTCELYDVQVKTKSPKNQMAYLIHTNTDIFHHQKNGTFDVYIPGVPCNGARCKYTFNDKAELIGNVVGFLPDSYSNSLIRIFPSTKSDNYFAFVSNLEMSDEQQFYKSDYNFVLIGSQKLLYIEDGSISELTHLALDHREENWIYKNSNGFFSLCKKYKVNITNVITCMQFNEDVMKFNETIAANESEEPFGIYNLPAGGIILAKRHHCHDFSCKSMSFEKWSHDAQTQKLYSVDNLDDGVPIRLVAVNADKDNRLCLFMYDSHDQKYRFIKKCLPKNVLSFN